MTIVESWKKNIGMLQPQNLKNLGLLSVKLLKDNIISVTKVSLLYVGIIFFSPFFYNILGTIFGNKFIFFMQRYLTPYLPRVFFIVATTLVLRSSVAKKNILYYVSYFGKALFSIFSITFIVTFIHFYFLETIFRFTLVYWLEDIFLLYFSILFSLFFYDTIGKNTLSTSIDSIRSATKMFLYNIVFFGVLALVLSFSLELSMWSINLLRTTMIIQFLLFILLYILLYLFLVPFIVTLYNALIYEQRSLYFRD